MATLKKTDLQKIVEEKEASILTLTAITKQAVQFADWSKYTIPMLKDYIGYLTQHHIKLTQAAIPIKAGLKRAEQAASPVNSGLDNNSDNEYINDSTVVSSNNASAEQQRRNTMSQINVQEVEKILKGAGFTLDEKTGIYTGPAEYGNVVVKFTAKTIRIVHAGNTQVIHQNKTSNASFAAVLMSIKTGGSMDEHVPQTFEQSPAPSPEREQSPIVHDNVPTPKPATMGGENSAPKTEKPTPKPTPKPATMGGENSAPKTEKPKAEKVDTTPIKPSNPNPDGSKPVFEELQTACNTVTSHETTIKSIWTGLGEKHGYSIKPIVAALHAEGVWPDAPKKDKEGNIIGLKSVYDENISKYVTVPMGYQAVYKAEKEAGQNSVGHFVNKAAGAFGRINPANQKTPEQVEQLKKDREAKQNAGLTPEKIMVQLSKYIELLKNKSIADLDSYVESNLTLQDSFERITTNKVVMDGIGDDMSGLPADNIDPMSLLS